MVVGCERLRKDARACVWGFFPKKRISKLCLKTPAPALCQANLANGAERPGKAERESGKQMNSNQSGLDGGNGIAAAESLPAGKTVEEYITKLEVAKRLKKKLRTIDNWMRRGILPYYKIGRSVAFKWTEIEEQLAKTCRVCRFKR